MPLTADAMFRTRDAIANAMLVALQGAIPDLYVGDDGVVRIMYEIEAAQLENVFMANQLLLEDIWPQSASSAALRLHGQTYAQPFKLGEKAEGELTFSGDGGTVIDLGTEVAADPGNSLEPIVFVTDEIGTIPDPGDALAPTVAVNATAGTLNGTYEYRVTFLTAAGEGLVGDLSAPVQPTNQQVNLTVIPIGGPGTTGRKIYRRRNGIDPFKLVTTINDNVATTYTDNIADASLTTAPPVTDTAHRITVDAIAKLVGQEGNVVPGAIAMLIDVPSGVTSVINLAAFLDGENPESIEQFRARLLEYIRMPRTGSPTDLKYWAETVNGVEEATVFNNDNLGTPQNGHATIRISGPAGAIPDAETIAEAQALLELKDLINVTLHVTTFTQVTQAVTVDVTTDAEHTIGEVTPSVQDAINDYINSVPVNGTIYRSGIIDAIFGLDGVNDVTISVPATNVTATATQKFIPGIVTIT
jgi:uncharacterized phage protein gp47/JayE